MREAHTRQLGVPVAGRTRRGIYSGVAMCARCAHLSAWRAGGGAEAARHILWGGHVYALRAPVWFGAAGLKLQKELFKFRELGLAGGEGFGLGAVLEGEGMGVHLRVAHHGGVAL